MPVLTQIKFRRDTAAQWALVNPILGDGEPGFATDTRLLKIGDGVTAWNDLDAAQSFALDVSTYVNGDGTDESVAYQNAIDDASALGRALLHPQGLAVRVATKLLLPTGFTWIGQGRGSLVYRTTAGGGTAGDAGAIAENEDRATSGDNPGITVVGMHFRCTAVLAGNEGPYSNLLNFRSCTGLLVAELTLEGNLGGVQFEGCTDWECREVYGWRQGDITVRVNWSGSDGPGGPPAAPGRVLNCTSREAGYQYGDGSAVPEPSGPVGSAFLCTQSDVEWCDITVIDARHNGFESGGGASGMLFDGWHLIVNTAGRGAGMLIADCDHVTIRNVTQVVRAAGSSVINVAGDGVSQEQLYVTIENVTGADTTGDTTQRSGISISTDSQHVAIRNVDYDGLSIGTGVGATDVTIEACTVRNAKKAGFALSGTDVRVIDCAAIDCGDGGDPDPKQRCGFILDGMHGSNAEVRDCLAIDTRSAGARTQEYGWYCNNATTSWHNNRARNMITGVMATDGVNTFTDGLPEVLPANTRAKVIQNTAGNDVMVLDSVSGKLGLGVGSNRIDIDGSNRIIDGVGGGVQMGAGSTDIANAFTFVDPIRVKGYTTATLPAAAAGRAGEVAYVSDAAAGSKFQGCDGSAWLPLG